MKTHRNIHTIAFFISHSSVHTESVKSLLILSLIALIVPVLQGCTEHPQDGDFTEAVSRSSVKVAVRHIQDTRTRSLDVLVFNDDALQRLDCYQNIPYCPEEDIMIGSCSGNKTLIICANLQWGKDDWMTYNSFTKACSMRINLEDEQKEYPVMASYTHFDAGDEAQVMMQRASSEIVLSSISCDFSGKPYDGEKITEARAYLTNINASCSILPQEHETMERIINHGGLIDQDLQKFSDKSLIMCELGEIGADLLQPSCKLLCYHNTSPEESVGTPFTRLVIEGRIQGEKWFWPIDINRGGANTGIERNRRYIFNITIRGKGTKNPDTPVAHHTADITFKAETWKEKEEYCVSF